MYINMVIHNTFHTIVECRFKCLFYRIIRRPGRTAALSIQFPANKKGRISIRSCLFYLEQTFCLLPIAEGTQGFSGIT